MNFNAPLLRPIRILLFPISLVYGAIIWVRNRAFDRNILGSTTFNLPMICVGNLSVGGTGKSTMVEFLIQRLHTSYRAAILSRGYKRKTKGYALANSKTTALEIGDEPMQFHLKFPEVAIAVGEARIEAIPQLLHDKPETELVVLDDAFQHRTVQAGFNIILTDYSNLYSRDWFLPTGDLRDEKSSASRAQSIIVTKCPSQLSHDQATAIRKELRPAPGQSVYFSTLKYGQPYHINLHHIKELDAETEVLLVSGIANPLPLKAYLHEHTKTYYEMLYSDHHIFTIDDWREILKRFDFIQSEKKLIITTEKDAVRLIKFAEELKEAPIYVLPITMEVLFNQEENLMNSIHEYIQKHLRKEINNV
ncbi:MAG: tetraacyldisaccharide 4'-kinase [Chitinophagaceae bacterium]|uniref:tetraacyldisaccharide 4'-kinase n=1 Tax=unclassified Paraflavitalea TaxID=2798305 RepID=UPI003D35206F|nr:tetraacyldisaccharide 4'-kinase [Chitinophagaceae bacterium]